MAVTCSDIIKLIAAFLLPPLGVFLVRSQLQDAQDLCRRLSMLLTRTDVGSGSVWAGSPSVSAGVGACRSTEFENTAESAGI